jgi:hypothetical protein
LITESRAVQADQAAYHVERIALTCGFAAISWIKKPSVNSPGPKRPSLPPAEGEHGEEPNLF